MKRSTRCVWGQIDCYVLTLCMCTLEMLFVLLQTSRAFSSLKMSFDKAFSLVVYSACFFLSIQASSICIKPISGTKSNGKKWINELKGCAQGLFRFPVHFQIETDVLLDFFFTVHWFNVKWERPKHWLFSFPSSTFPASTSNSMIEFLNLNNQKLTELCDLYVHIEINSIKFT